MNWKSLRLVACAFVASLAVAGCSKEDARDVARGEGSKDQDVKVNLNLDIEDLTPEVEKGDDEFRLSIKDRPKVGGKNNGVQFVFDTLANGGKGEKVKLHTYFRQGTTIKVGTPIDIYVKGMKTVGTTNTPVWSGLGELRVPAGINLSSSEDIFVAGAIGVKSIDANGEARIEPADIAIDEMDEKVDVSVPMYFSEIKLNKADTTLSKAAHLRFYGALIDLELRNNMNEPLLLNQIVMRTDAFTSKGSMKLRTATDTKEPEWKADQYPSSWSGKPSKDQKISFSSDVLEKNKVRKTFLWVKPADYTGRKNLKLWVREGNYTYSPEERNEAIDKTYNVKRLETKVYRLPIEAIPNPTLIYTEHRRQSSGFVWEIYNPSKKRIYLRDYYHNRLKWSDSGRKLEILKSDRLTDGSNLALAYSKRDGRTRDKESGQLIYPNYLKNNPVPSNMYLDPGEMILFIPFFWINEEVKNASKRPNVAYVVRFDQDNSQSYKNAFVGDADYHDMYVLTQGGPARKGSNSSVVDLTNVVDNFFYFESTSSRRRINEVNYARRPDRNFGRKFWAPGEDGPDSDWVYRQLNTAGHGYRFDWYYEAGQSKPANPNDATTRPWKYLEHGRISRKQFAVPFIWTQELAKRY